MGLIFEGLIFEGDYIREVFLSEIYFLSEQKIAKFVKQKLPILCIKPKIVSMIWFKIYIIVITIIVDTYKSGSKFRLHQRTMVLSSCIEQNRCYQFIYHYFEYEPMRAHGLIFEGAYIRMVFLSTNHWAYIRGGL